MYPARPAGATAGYWLAGGGWEAAVAMGGVGAVVGMILAGVYRLNRAAVRDELEPRRGELKALLAGLQDPPADGQELPQ